MNGIKEYKLIINGVAESINAVESLNKQLDNLEKRINALQGKAVNVSAKSGGSTSDYKEQDKLIKQIESAEEKLANTRREEYQTLLKTKDAIKDSVKEQKQMTAEARLAENAYENTMNGLKNHLADIKSVMGNTTIGSDSFKNLTKDANEITQKLKELEQAYGTFSRSVGNYASAAEGFKGFKVVIGDTVREFSSAREAAKSLKNELYGLGKEDVEQANKLREAIYNIESQMKDAMVTSKAMDEAMDWMQSFAAIGNMAQGLKGFFGIDNSKIMESIKRLQSLQSVLQGVESLRKQMATGEGIGRIIGKGNAMIDTATNKMLVYNRALLGTGKAARAAEKGIKAVNTALKAVKFFVIIEVVSTLIDKISSFFGKAEDVTSSVANSIERLNKSYEDYFETLQTDYLTGVISQEEYLNKLYKERAEQLRNNATLLKSFGNNLNDVYSRGVVDDILSSIPIVSKAINTQHGYQQTAGNWGTFGHGQLIDFDSYDTSIYIENLEQAEDALNKLNKAFENGAENFDHYISQLNNASTTLATTQNDWKQIRKEIGGRVLTENIQKSVKQLANLSDSVGDLQEAYNNGSISEEEFANKLGEFRNDAKSLYDYLSKNELLKTAIFNMPEFIDNAEFREKLMEAYDSAKTFAQNMAGLDPQLRQWWNHFVNVETKRGLERELAELEEQRKQAVLQAQTLGEDLQVVNDEYNRRAQEKRDDYAKEAASKAKQQGEELLKIERDIEDRRINLMQDGLAKTVAQLTVERERRLQEARKTGIRIGEQEVLINREYQQRVLNARIQYYNTLLQEQQKFADAEYNLQKTIYGREQTWVSNAYDRRLEIAIMALNKYPEALERNLNFYREYEEERDKLYDENEDQITIVDEYKELLSLSTEELGTTLNSLNRDYLANVNDLVNQGYAEARRILTAGNDDMYLINEEYANDVIVLEQTLTERLDVDLQDRLKARKEYYNKILELQKEAAKLQLEQQNSYNMSMLQSQTIDENKRFEQLAGLYQKQVERLNDEGQLSGTLTKNPILNALEAYENLMNDISNVNLSNLQIGTQLESVKDEVDEFINELESGFANGLISFQQYNETMQSELLQTYIAAKKQYEDFLDVYNAMSASQQQQNEGQLKQFENIYYESFATFLNNLENAQETHNNALNVIQNEYRENERQANLQYLKQIQDDTNAAYSKLATEVDRGLNAISRNIQTFHTSNRISSEFGFINLKQLKKDVNAAKEILYERIDEIGSLKQELYEKLALNEISEEDFSAQIDSLNALSTKAQEEIETLNKKVGDGIDKTVAVINAYVQVVGQSLQTIMSSMYDYQMYQFEEQQNLLDKENEMIQDKLKKQEDILQKHSDNVNSIEDELSTARGDRRQHLIDQLNAEIQAQREAAAEKKRLEKEEQKNEEKMKDLEYERRKADYENNLRSILVSGAMAISNAFATIPFVPVGIAMGALATSLTGFQYAMAKKQKPKKYATGGLLDGPSHKQGGIPVGNTGLEVEGGEFITNKYTTSKNAPLLDYINSSKKKLNLSDFVEFYSDNVKKNVTSIRKKVYADGGLLETPNIDISNQKKDYVLVQDNRPVIVEVREILNKTEDVRRVQAIAGIASNKSI